MFDNEDDDLPTTPAATPSAPVRHLVVIGAGLSGLYAGILALRQGWQCTIAAFGWGGLSLSPGCIDIHSYRGQSALASPDFQGLPENHPYNVLPREHLVDALPLFADICARAGYPLHGEIDSNLQMPSALGSVRSTSLVPLSFVAAALAPDGLGIAGIRGWRDFYPELVTANWGRDSHPFWLSLPENIARPRDFFSTDIAHLLENGHAREQICSLWEREIARERSASGRELATVGIPACLGLRQHEQILHDVEDALQAHVFEIPTLPPSVPGLRLQAILQSEFLQLGGQWQTGAVVRGQINRFQLAEAAAFPANGRRLPLVADAFLLASGGFAHGGLQALTDGGVQESVFSLPVSAPTARAEWSAPQYFSQQAFARFGVAVNAEGRALDAYGAVAAENLWACGGILAGADRAWEGSRAGISLLSAYIAVQSLTGKAIEAPSSDHE